MPARAGTGSRRPSFIGHSSKNPHWPTGGNHVLKYILMIAKVGILRVRECVLRVPNHVAFQRPPQPHHAARIGHRQRFECNRVVGGKQRGVDTHSERNGDNCNQREYGAAAKRANGVAKVLHGVLKPQQRTLVAVRLLCLFHAAIGALRR